MVKTEITVWRSFAGKYFPACLLAAILIAVSCKLDSPEELVIDNKVDIYYEDSSHQDLLDTAIVGSFKADSIHLFNVEDGFPKEVYNRVPYPGNFYIYKNELLQKYVLRVYLETTSTYIKLNRHITDTIDCTFYGAGGNFIINKVWYNGILKWEDYATPREITVVVK